MFNSLLKPFIFIFSFLLVPFFSKSYFELPVEKSIISIQKGDILQAKADAVVNPANASLRMGGGVCGLMFQAAGPNQLEKECENALLAKGVDQLQVSEVVKTFSCNFKRFKSIFHVVPPNFNPINSMQQSIPFDQSGKNLLKKSYLNLLEAAAKSGIDSIAVPFLSGANFCRDKNDLPEMAKIAVEAAKKFCRNTKQSIKIKFVLFSQFDFDLFKKFLT